MEIHAQSRLRKIRSGICRLSPVILVPHQRVTIGLRHYRTSDQSQLRLSRIERRLVLLCPRTLLPLKLARDVSQLPINPVF
jgi:hypothetical protein